MSYAGIRPFLNYEETRFFNIKNTVCKCKVFIHRSLNLDDTEFQKILTRAVFLIVCMNENTGVNKIYLGNISIRFNVLKWLGGDSVLKLHGGTLIPSKNSYKIYVKPNDAELNMTRELLDTTTTSLDDCIDVDVETLSPNYCFQQLKNLISLQTKGKEVALQTDGLATSLLKSKEISTQTYTSDKDFTLRSQDLDFSFSPPTYKQSISRNQPFLKQEDCSDTTFLSFSVCDGASGQILLRQGSGNINTPVDLSSTVIAGHQPPNSNLEIASPVLARRALKRRRVTPPSPRPGFYKLRGYSPPSGQSDSVPGFYRLQGYSVPPSEAGSVASGESPPNKRSGHESSGSSGGSPQQEPSSEKDENGHKAIHPKQTQTNNTTCVMA